MIIKCSHPERELFNNGWTGQLTCTLCTFSVTHNLLKAINWPADWSNSDKLYLLEELGQW